MNTLMRLVSVFGFLLVSFQPSSVRAMDHVRQITVNSIVYSDTGCGYFSTNSGEFTFYFPMERLPNEVRTFIDDQGLENVKARVHYGFRETNHGGDWIGEAWSEPMNLSKSDETPGYDTNNTLRVKVQAQVAARGYFFYKDLQFVFHFDLADGRKFSDNGVGVPFGGEYEITLPSMVCDKKAPRTMIPVRVNRRN